jgi:hypothetical protein
METQEIKSMKSTAQEPISNDLLRNKIIFEYQIVSYGCQTATYIEKPYFPIASVPIESNGKLFENEIDRILASSKQSGLNLFF